MIEKLSLDQVAKELAKLEEVATSRQADMLAYHISLAIAECRDLQKKKTARASDRNKQA